MAPSSRRKKSCYYTRVQMHVGVIAYLQSFVVPRWGKYTVELALQGLTTYPFGVWYGMYLVMGGGVGLGW